MRQYVGERRETPRGSHATDMHNGKELTMLLSPVKTMTTT